MGKLNHIISEADADRFRQKREYDQVINERDILGTQLLLTLTLTLPLTLHLPLTLTLTLTLTRYAAHPAER